MDNNWMSLSRVTIEYLRGLENFLEHMFSNESYNGHIVCPCIKCGNEGWVNRENARMHLICDGFIKGYKISFASTQPSICPASNTLDDMQGLVRDAFYILDENIDADEIDIEGETSNMPNAQANNFYKVLEDANKELYRGCKKFSVLSFIIRLFHCKCIGKCNDHGFSMILDLLREAFPDTIIPKSLYEMKKTIRDLGLSYDKIDACPNDCMLYRKEKRNDTQCDICHTSRYKVSEDDPEDQTTAPHSSKKIAAKVLRYFPLKPRLQRLFMSSKTAASMRWHEENRTKDGCLRHPADSPAWKTFDFLYPEFAKEPRNVRLGLASDGFNPFRTMSVSHSTWPVVLFPYNLPPWMCMKQPYFMLSLIIPSPFAPGNNIDVYLQPLVDELKELWDVGIETYDASAKNNFQMRASLLSTISDFPAYANLSGWSTKGQFACPSCHKHTKSQRLKHGRKYCYMGHRRYLPNGHSFRKDKDSFDGIEEHDRPPGHLTGTDVLHELNGYEITFRKLVKDNPHCIIIISVDKTFV